MQNEYIENLLSSVGVPIAYRKFKPYRNNPVPPPPYIIYIIERESGHGADSKNLLVKKSVFMELYSVKKNSELEKKIETSINAFEWDKYEDTIESENLYVVSYEFDIFEKIRR